jgi:hypothetical protein
MIIDTRHVLTGVSSSVCFRREMKRQYDCHTKMCLLADAVAREACVCRNVSACEPIIQKSGMKFVPPKDNQSMAHVRYVREVIAWPADPVS